jgi:hypothetical protein
MHLNQTVCNRKLEYYDSCTLRKGSVMYPRLVILSLAKRLEITTCHYKGLLQEYSCFAMDS